MPEMSYLMKLVEYPALILKQKATPIPFTKDQFEEAVRFDEDPTNLLVFMNGVLEGREAIGLAANQCNVPRRVFLMRRFYMVEAPGGRVEFEPRGNVMTAINPEIVDRSQDLRIFIEGCLSFPGKSVKTRRPATIKVTYYDEHGKFWCEILEGLEAIIFQHELDHLNGKTMRDREFAGRV